MKSFQFSRRQFVEQCALGAFGLTVLPHLKASSSLPAGNGFGKAKRIIFLQVRGGMSHIDTFDPKSGKTQGPGKAIKTKADFQVTQYLPNTAQIYLNHIFHGWHCSLLKYRKISNIIRSTLCSWRRQGKTCDGHIRLSLVKFDF